MHRTVLFLAVILAVGPALAQEALAQDRAGKPKPGEAATGTQPADPAKVQPAEPATVPMPAPEVVVPDVLPPPAPSTQPGAKENTGKPAAEPKK